MTQTLEDILVLSVEILFTNNQISRDSKGTGGMRCRQGLVVFCLVWLCYVTFNHLFINTLSLEHTLYNNKEQRTYTSISILHNFSTVKWHRSADYWNPSPLKAMTCQNHTANVITSDDLECYVEILHQQIRNSFCVWKDDSIYHDDVVTWSCNGGIPTVVTYIIIFVLLNLIINRCSPGIAAESSWEKSSIQFFLLA